MAYLELDDIGDQLAKSAKMEECLRRCVDNLTVLAETERMRRDRDEQELRTTVDRLTAELDEVRQDLDQMRSVEAEISMEMMRRESAQDERDEALRTDNARLQAELGAGGIVEAALQSKVFKLELELTIRTDAVQVQQEQFPAGSGGGSADGSSMSTMLYQCNLSRTSDDQVACSSDLGRGDDQSIPSLLLAKDIAVAADAEDDRLPCAQSIDDCRLLCSPSITDVQDNVETASEPSLPIF